MNSKERAEIESRYEYALRKIKRWLVIAAATAAITLTLWKIVAPLLPPSLGNEVALWSTAVFGLAAYVVFASLFLWVSFARERKRKLDRSR